MCKETTEVEVPFSPPADVCSALHVVEELHKAGYRVVRVQQRSRRVKGKRLPESSLLVTGVRYPLPHDDL